MTILQVLAIIALGAGGWFVWDSLKVREAANAAMRAACVAERLLFLDDTVALISVRPMRDADGRLAFRRVYAFEYSDTGHERRKGSIVMAGASVEWLHLEGMSAAGAATLH